MRAENDIDPLEVPGHAYALGKTQLRKNDDNVSAFGPGICDVSRQFLIAHREPEADIEGLRLVWHRVAGDAKDCDLYASDLADDVGIVDAFSWQSP